MSCNQVGILLCKCIWQANFTSTSHQSHLDGKVYCLKFFVVCVCACVSWVWKGSLYIETKCFQRRRNGTKAWMFRHLDIISHFSYSLSFWSLGHWGSCSLNSLFKIPSCDEIRVLWPPGGCGSRNSSAGWGGHLEQHLYQLGLWAEPGAFVHLQTVLPSP